MEKYRLSERHACELNGLDRSTYRYEPEPDRNAQLRVRLTELARQRPRFGYRRLGVLLEKDGEVINHKRLLRVYQEAGLAVRRRERKRLARDRVGMPVLTRPNQEWSIDFVSDALATGRAIRSLTVLDDFTKESPAIEVDTSLSGLRVTRVLDRNSEAREAGRASAGQRSGIHEPVLHRVGRAARGSVDLYPARKAGTEQLHREFQRTLSG